MIWHKIYQNNKQPLVLLHGWGFSSDIFKPIINQLLQFYQVILIDLPGHGRSDEVEGGFDEWLDVIVPLIPKNANIAGWSLGGLLAVKLAKITQAKSLILLASTPCFIQHNNWQYGVDKNNFIQFSNILNLNLSKGLKNFVHLQLSDKTQLSHIVQNINNYPATIKALNQGLDILLKTDLRDDLVNLALPITAILGKRDTLINVKIMSWYYKNNINCVQLSGGHLPFLHPNFNAILIKSTPI